MGKLRALRKAKFDDRRAKALEMRLSGKTYREIAEELGYSGSSNCQKDVTACIEARIAEPAAALLKLELGRLDHALKKIWPAIEQGDLHAVDRLLKIMDRRARFMGLDAPTRNEVTGRDGGAMEVLAATPEMAARLVREAFGSQNAGKLDAPVAAPALPVATVEAEPEPIATEEESRAFFESLDDESFESFE